MSQATKTVTIGTIGRLDVGDTFGFQTTRTLKDVGNTFPIKVQIPEDSPPYGIARIKEFRIQEPYNWVLAIRIS